MTKIFWENNAENTNNKPNDNNISNRVKIKLKL